MSETVLEIQSSWSGSQPSKTGETGSAGIDAAWALVARMEKVVDRFQHRIYLVGNSAEYCLLQSVEGDDTNDAPPSPPVQDPSVEKRDGSQVALGVGMAGPSLWSFSIEATDQQGRLDFDIACNHRGGPARPASTYEVPSSETPSGEWQIVPNQDAGSLSLRLPEHQIQLVLHPLLPGHPATSVSLEDQRQILITHPVGDAPETYRWCYRMQLSPLPT